MLYITASDTISAYEKAKAQLIKLPEPLDRELSADCSALIVMPDLEHDVSVCGYDGKAFTPNCDYDRYFANGNRLFAVEAAHYQKRFRRKHSELTTYLEQNPLSKRAIIFLWDEPQMQLTNPAECLVYMLFRQTSDGLDMHAHMRANNAASISLINFHIFAAFQKLISIRLGLPLGVYYHYADSYHIYK